MLGEDSILFRKSWPATKLDGQISAVNVDALAREYYAERKAEAKAHSRYSRGKCYFVDEHTGEVGRSLDESNQFEKHFARALCNQCHRWPRAGGGWVRFLDYEVPLQASGLGKRNVDLFGITDRGRAVVHELKVIGMAGGRGDSPAVALMEGLRYAACIEANLEGIVKEAHTKFRVDMVNETPIVQILAPRRWWCEWWKVPKAGDWGKEMANLSERIAEKIGVPVEFMATEDVTKDDIRHVPCDGKFRPELCKIPDLFQVNLANRSFTKTG